MYNAIKTVALENYNNRYRLYRLAAYELKAQNSGTFFGFLWNILNPALQIFVYWFVFSYALKIADPPGGYPYLLWMIVGIIPWFYLNSAMMSSTMSIYNFSHVLKNTPFPLSVVPIKTVLSNLMGHFWAMLVVIVIYLFYGFKPSISFFAILYYGFCSFMFLTGFALTASAVTVVFKDFQKIMSSLLRLLFYITPILWSPHALPQRIQFILNLNPLAYIIDGYRASILNGNVFSFHWTQVAYFWLFTIVLLIFGCNIHMRLRNNFIDLI